MNEYTLRLSQHFPKIVHPLRRKSQTLPSYSRGCE